MASIDLRGISKSFGDNEVIRELDLRIEDGSFTVLVGPSGCGKTTLLRMIAGLDTQTSGDIFIDGSEVTDIRPGQRDIAMVFQNYALYPTMTVRDNISFGLKKMKMTRTERRQLVDDIAETVGLKDFLGRKPGTLSGGQRQRVALARAMVKKPSIFLMDEPLSNLDAKLRAQMRIELIELHRLLGTTFVYVTHDQGEAMSMADKIVLMNEGEIQQTAPPEVIYHQPANEFTAQFIGVPPMNILTIGESRIGFRPEALSISQVPVDGEITLKGRIVTREMLGSETVYQIRNDEHVFMAKSANPGFSVDQDVFVSVRQHQVVQFDTDGQRLDPKLSRTVNAHA